MDEAEAVYDDDFCLDNGLVGQALTIASANPKNFYQAISETAAMPRLDLWAKLFVPDGAGPFPVVIVVPGSLGLQSHHLAHASTIAGTGIAACAIDPGSFVINLGDLMAAWTNDRWVSTMHRVVNPKPEFCDTSRMSVVFFHQPNYDAEIHCIPLLAPCAPPKTRREVQCEALR